MKPATRLLTVAVLVACAWWRTEGAARPSQDRTMHGVSHFGSEISGGISRHWLVDNAVVVGVCADPEPQESVGRLDGKSAVV